MSGADVGLVTVTLRMTAVASGGDGPASVISPRPVGTSGVLAATFALGALTPLRVSRTRTGVTGRNRDGVPPATGRGAGPCATGCAWSPAAATKTPARVPARSTLQMSPGSASPAAL